MTYVEMEDGGRLVLPEAICQELNLERGTRLAVAIEDGALILMSAQVALRRLRARLARYPASLADELVTERRTEQAREDSE
jgi:antitoxin component of MazEF toxin-antitoxin module